MVTSRSKSRLVFVRSKKTGDIDICRANELAKCPSATPLQERVLHYIGSDRSRICGCTSPKRHYDDFFPVASESTHLNSSLSMYMDRHDLDFCTIASFIKWQQRVKAAWAKDGVFIDDFHYANQRRAVVCRCSNSNAHSYGIPRNPMIIEQCAEYFRTYRDTIACSRNQWQTVDGDSPPAYSPESPDDPFKYDSQSSYGYIHNRTVEGDRLPVSPEMEIRSTAEHVAPADMMHLRSGPCGEADIPEQVWKKARPSVWVPRRGSDTAASTPLGTASSPYGTRIPPLAHLRRPQRASTATNWSNIQRSAGVSDDRTSPETHRGYGPNPADSCFNKASIQEAVQNVGMRSRNPWGCRASRIGTTMGAPSFSYEKDADEPSPEYSEFGRSMSTPLLYNKSEGQGTPTVELPAQRAAVELDTKPLYRHSPTLWELEGHCWGPTSNFAGQQYPVKIPPSSLIRKNYLSNKPIALQLRRISKKTCVSELAELHRNVVYLKIVAHRVEMPLSSASPVVASRAVAHNELPRQKQFLKHDLVLSTADTTLPQPGTGCGVCLEELVVPERPFGPGTTTTIVFLKPCTHFFHKGCIVEWHTSARPERDTCPICRRTLFVADPLSPAQIQRLYDAAGLTFTRRPLGPHRHPRSNEEVLSWEACTIHIYANRAVQQEIDRVLISGGRHRWGKVCKEARDEFLAAGGTLRPVFEPYRDSFLLLIVAMSVQISIACYDHAIRCRAFVKLHERMKEMSATIGSERDFDLSMEMHRNGLFVSETLRVVTVPRAFRQSLRTASLRVCGLKAEMEKRRERRSMGGLLRRLAKNVLSRRLFLMLHEGGV
ncbi:uncharacterized protein K460DRAFT_398309 [Cucurbitaria berberidis CBS 394.84]|uniref:RING-type domain-containing protein n=1 Tax=Cucurbitaria berberidis CBS 394.84 TaxID=1168544 RepID=A0A9P4GBP6_9PLEO|nr:uncharacterized protein K460DRAFT_398309 [Cucurbitaria berberidis CBS 394.84]KAF1842290.1 hypothetical protein K460DRAFT_398309 [Cucurbitaria berberidis CBS 394.84]